MGRWVLMVAVLAGPALADDDCTVPMVDWQPRAAVSRFAETQGLTIRRLKIDDGCYEIDGWDSEGRRVEITLDPATLAVVGMEDDAHLSEEIDD